MNRRDTSFPRRLRRYFAGPVYGGGRPVPVRVAEGREEREKREKREKREGIFTRQARQFTSAQVIVRGFYAFVLYYAVTQCTEFATLFYRLNFSPLWPVSWISLASTRLLPIAAVAGFYALASVLGAFFARDRWARVLVFAGMLEYFSLRNSFGKIGHSTHLFVLTALLLIFLPADWHRPAALASRRTRQTTLLVFWLAQAVVLLSYTMSGFGKLGCAFYQIAAGQPSAFSPGALGAQVAQRLVQTHSQSLLGSFIIDHPFLTWPLMPGPLYLELFAFWIAFRPAVQRWWALGLILFHVGTIFTLTITFPVACLLLALFFFQSPFQPTAMGWRETLADVPLLGELLDLPSALRRKAGGRNARAIPRDPGAPTAPVSS